MTLPTTTPGELGEVAAEAVRETVGKARGVDNVSTFAETGAPVRWQAVADAGWDLAGVIEDDDSATLRDLVAIADAWGEQLVPLPFIPSLLAKRHSAAAVEAGDGPVSISLPSPTLPAGSGVVPFGATDGVSVLRDLGSAPVALDPAASEPLDFDPLLRASVVPFTTTLTHDFARELIVLWAAEVAGTARTVVADAVAFTKEREQFGRPIGSFQAVKHHMANAHISSQMAETAAIWASLDEANAIRSALHSFDESIAAIELALQVHGGLGFTWEMGIHFYLRHATFLRELSRGVATRA